MTLFFQAAILRDKKFHCTRTLLDTDVAEVDIHTRLRERAAERGAVPSRFIMFSQRFELARCLGPRHLDPDQVIDQVQTELRGFRPTSHASHLDRRLFVTRSC